MWKKVLHQEVLASLPVKVFFGNLSQFKKCIREKEDQHCKNKRSRYNVPIKF